MGDRFDSKIDILNRVYVDLRDTLDWLKKTPFEYEDGSKEEEFIGILENFLRYTVTLDLEHLNNSDIDIHYEIVKMFVNKLSERTYMITKKLINGTPWGITATTEELWAVVKNWFNDDGSDLVISIGVGGRVSYITTKALEGGIIFDPKNNVVQALGLALLIASPTTAGAGLALMYANAEEVALYGSASGGLGTGFNLKDMRGDQKKGIIFSFSGSIAIGVWRSMEDLKGLSYASGGSGSLGVSVGGDIMRNADGELIGVVVDLGVGTGAALEAHLRTPGVTGIVELPNLEEFIDIIEEKFSDK